jgi:D-beta-D-heptose 7-phosphate kinase / D-beta-D-heptose 1-phosphate adenosyltransferase
MFELLTGVLDHFAERAPQVRVLVAGDLMLDRYVTGRVSRVSPEAPVPVLHFAEQSARLGGAANVAANLRALGASVSLVGLIGADSAGDDLRAAAAGAGIDTRGVIATASRPTTVKTRMVSGQQQLLRIDTEHCHPIAPDDADALHAQVATRLDAVDAVLLSDYLKGTLTESLTRRIIADARSRALPVLVDPKGRSFTRYKGATAITPNRHELLQAVDWQDDSLDGLILAAGQLRSELGLDCILLTLSEHGMALIDEGASTRISALAREVFDVSGAGDTVIAAFTAGLAAGLTRGQAAELANVAAGVVVGKAGTATVTVDEIRAYAHATATPTSASKISGWEAAASRVKVWQAQGDRIVFTNGCFDLLHAGHVDYLEKARQLGDRLIVGLNTDASVSRLKGSARPFVAEGDRARVLAGLQSVDLVVPFPEDNPLELIRHLRPQVLAKGGDYTIEKIVGATDVQAAGGQVHVIPLVEGRSTTALAQRIQAPTKPEAVALNLRSLGLGSESAN